jgi:hypothetical protein
VPLVVVQDERALYSDQDDTKSGLGESATGLIQRVQKYHCRILATPGYLSCYSTIQITDMKLTFLFITLLLTGFYAGTGFFGLMGANPALSKVSSSTFAEYWQHLDHYMAARMRIFGPLLLLSVIITVVLHARAWHGPAFWLLAAALLILVADVIIAFTINVPLNKLIQGWDLSNLPENVQDVKQRVITAFYYRSCFMIACFVCVLASLAFTVRSSGNV